MTKTLFAVAAALAIVAANAWADEKQEKAPKPSASSEKGAQTGKSETKGKAKGKQKKQEHKDEHGKH